MLLYTGAALITAAVPPLVSRGRLPEAVYATPSFIDADAAVVAIATRGFAERYAICNASG